MAKFIPSIPTVDQVIAIANNSRKIVINGQPYVARSVNGRSKDPYYKNPIKRVIAAFYILFGKGMVVRFSEDTYKRSEIKSIQYK